MTAAGYCNRIKTEIITGKGDVNPAYRMLYNRQHGYGWRRADKINSTGNKGLF
ncbi:hypothetical protein HMPREF1548_06371 [Clostridium sp. KLE 1755]|nr:hypothetical protein HMPREF1548_06371 [Clostridium sp. KLE 1755]